MKVSNPGTRFGVQSKKDGSSRYYIPHQDELDDWDALDKPFLSNEENETPEERAAWKKHASKLGMNPDQF